MGLDGDLRRRGIETDIDGTPNFPGGLKIAGATLSNFNDETVLADAAELNILNGATLTTAELNTLDGVIASATVTPGVAAAGAVDVVIQLKDAAGVNLAKEASLLIVVMPVSPAVAITTIASEGGVPVAAQSVWIVSTDGTGAITVTCTEAAAGSAYNLGVILPNGTRVLSDPFIPTPA